MPPILPPGITEARFSAILERLAKVVGKAGLISAEAELDEYRDPYAFAERDTFRPAAVVLPTTVEQIQEILRIAADHTPAVPLWVVSQGRNLGYGGPAPRVPGSVVVSLRRMNRILEVNEECAYAVVEPGVSFTDLYEHLRAGGHKLMLSVPDLGWGSVVGNALDRGRGYTQYGDHAASCCGMEVVLPSGDVLRTGMGAMTNNRSWHVYRNGFGPSVDGLFMQSNLGIVTRMGVWLMPTPECYLSATVCVPRESDLEPLIDTVRTLMLDRLIHNYPVIGNALSAAATFSSRSQWYQGEGPVPEEVIDRLCRDTGLGRWNMRFALYGAETVVDTQFALVRAAFERIPGVRIEARKYQADTPPDSVPFFDKSQGGIPSLDYLRAVKWRAETGGHLGFSPVAPLTGKEARAQCDLLSPIMQQHGFDYMGGIIILPRCLIQIFEFIYDASDEKQTEAARQGCKALVSEATAARYGEYRSHIESMDAIADTYDFNGRALRRFTETIKDAVDPKGILSPGKQGIWPQSMRPRHH
jgi:4-cresol dehydrogenase (hydroxylating)